MGRALVEAAIAGGHDVVVVSGPVVVSYPSEAEVRSVVTTQEMLDVSRQAFRTCDGMIGVAAPCDYRPVRIDPHKIAKTGKPLVLELVETPDIVASLGAEKGDRWVVGFALETQDHHFRAVAKMERKRCDLMVINTPQAMDRHDNEVEIIDPRGRLIRRAAGRKEEVAVEVFQVVEEWLIKGRDRSARSARGSERHRPGASR
jgi:phosphopantothenoylcysteine decarboxylase/phosphopantothenate--cysteine ligase